MESLHAKRAAIVFNPIARGLSRRRHSLQRIIDILRESGIQSSLVETKGPGTAGWQTRQLIEAGCGLIVAAGGDGTINEVAAGMLHTAVPLAILPGGTANVLAHELRLPRQPERVAAELRQLQPCRIAVGKLRMGSQQRIFLCMAGAGLDAEIVYRLNLDLKAVIGKFAYYVAGFGQVLRPLTEFEVTVDGQRHEASFALVSRVRNYGGDLEIARGASLLRDEFEVVLFRGTKSVRYLQYLFGVTVGRAHQMKGCCVLRGRSVICQQPANRTVYVQVDGEVAGQLPGLMEIIPDALTVLVPPAYLVKEQALAAVPVCA